MMLFGPSEGWLYVGLITQYRIQRYSLMLINGRQRLLVNNSTIDWDI